MAQREQILEYIKSKTTFDILLNSINNNSPLGVSASEIETNFQVVRNNSSTLLNKLHKESILVKIVSRPVTFIHYENLIPLNLNKSSYKLDELKSIIKDIHDKDLYDADKDDIYDPFSKLVGHSSSLLSQITKAKAAILYPPNGLNTLILGESGVGKTTFANAMYEFAKEHRPNEKEIPFIAFNCSDYFNNPHLLLSQLFGHVKGAFTGADSDKEGLVEKANNGILFLDEIHRLSADGQEMLFYLMDNGRFNRLGETSKTRKSNVLIIAATTENPDDVLLNTFLRRIPVTLKLPSFCERNIEERIEIIKNLFLTESANLKISITVDSSVLKSLWLYDFSKGNLGQLYSEVKLLCAKGFLNLVKDQQTNINISFDMLNKDIASNYNNLDEISKNFYNLDKNQIIFNPDDLEKNHVLKVSNAIDDNIYDRITNKLSTLKTSDFSDEEIDEEISIMISNHCKSLSNKFNTDTVNLHYLDKIVDNNIYSFSSLLINHASIELQAVFSDKFILLLSMHIQSLISRLLNGISVKKLNLKKIQAKHPREFKVAEYFLSEISNKFNLVVPEYEKGFLTMLLSNNQENCNSSDIGILVMCHGNSTATSIANVANTILDSNIVRGIDMPLSTSVNDFYDKALSTIISMDAKEGVLLLVDMGSLINIGDKISQATNINIKTICNVSTLTALEALRQVLLNNYSLDDVYDNLVNTFNRSTALRAKKNAVLTLCATGKGSSIIAKGIIEDMLKTESSLSNIEIIPIEYENHINKISELDDKYNIIACVGNLRPKSDIYFFSINQLFSKGFDSQFKNFLLSKVNPNKKLEVTTETDYDIYDKSARILSKYVKYINPHIAVNTIKKAISSLDFSNMNNDHIMDLVLHIGCMMDRCIRGQFAIFDNKENFIRIFSDNFSTVKSAFKVIENDFDMNIPDDEICFTIQVLNRK